MTAQTSLKRTYSWKIEKTVSQSAVTLKAGETADVTYSVTATPTGSVDSDWAVSRARDRWRRRSSRSRIRRPCVNTVNVTIQPDALAAPVTCVPSPFPVDLDTNSLECDYSAPLPDASGPRDAHMRATQVNGNVRNVHTAFDFSNATVNLVDESVTVTDSMGGTLGTVNAADGPKTFTYTKTIGPYTAAQCGSKTVDNTATYTTVDSAATGRRAPQSRSRSPVRRRRRRSARCRRSSGSSSVSSARTTSRRCCRRRWARQAARRRVNVTTTSDRACRSCSRSGSRRTTSTCSRRSSSRRS